MEIENPQIQKNCLLKIPKGPLSPQQLPQVKILHRDVKPAWGSPGCAHVELSQEYAICQNTNIWEIPYRNTRAHLDDPIFLIVLYCVDHSLIYFDNVLW